MKDKDTQARVRRREVLRAGVLLIAMGPVRVASANKKTVPRIRTKPLRREDLKSNKDLAG